MSDAAVSYGYSEILQIADAVSREKGIPKESVIDAMEQAIQVAGRRKYGNEQNIRAEIDRKSGAIQLFRVRTVIDPNQPAAEEGEEHPIDTDNDQIYITVEDAKKLDSAL